MFVVRSLPQVNDQLWVWSWVIRTKTKPISISFSKCKYLKLKKINMGKFTFWRHTKHFQSTLSQRNNRFHSDWLKSVSDFDKPCLYHPVIHPPHDYVLSSQIV